METREMENAVYSERYAEEEKQKTEKKKL